MNYLVSQGEDLTAGESNTGDSSARNARNFTDFPGSLTGMSGVV